MSTYTEHELLDNGWSKTASGRWRHKSLTAGGGRMRLVDFREACSHQRQIDQRLDREARSAIRDALTRPITTDKQVNQRANLISALTGVPKSFALHLAERERTEAQRSASDADQTGPGNE